MCNLEITIIFIIDSIVYVITIINVIFKCHQIYFSSYDRCAYTILTISIVVLVIIINKLVIIALVYTKELREYFGNLWVEV